MHPALINATRKMETLRSGLKPWAEYPVGTKAHALSGGYWIKTARGWRWGAKGGSTFPTPGADAYVVTEPGAEIVGRI